MDQDGTWHGYGPWSWPHCVRWKPRSPPQKGGGAPKFSDHVYCDQTTGWIKMALGMEVGLGPRHIVLDGDPAPLPKKGDSSSIFGPFLLCPNGCMNQEATCNGGRPQPIRLTVFDVTQPPSQKGAEPPNVRPTSIVAKRLHGSRCHMVRRQGSVYATLC